MKFTGAAVNSEHSGPWIDAIGKFVINFGFLEYLSYEWLDLFNRLPERAAHGLLGNDHAVAVAQ